MQDCGDVECYATGELLLLCVLVFGLLMVVITF